MKKIYKREQYLKKIRGFYDEDEIIKVITGVRRCGKSTLLEIVKEELKERGIPERNIISIHLDKRPYKSVKKADELESDGISQNTQRSFVELSASHAS